MLQPARWLFTVAVCAFLTGCPGDDLSISTKIKCGEQITYTPSKNKNAFRLRVQGQCPVQYTVQCTGGTDPTPGIIKPGASALVNCDPGKTVKTANLACEKAENQKCEFSYEVLDIQ